jgi:K+-transporting ATPase ATPase A chain
MLDSLTTLLLVACTAALALPVGRYMARVYGGQPTWLDAVLGPLERLFYRLPGLNPTQQMRWAPYLGHLLALHAAWLTWAVLVLRLQDHLPAALNPDHAPAMSWTQALHTGISFLTSTNAQHYSGETGAAYFTQLAVLGFLQFVSAGTSLAVGVAVVRALGRTDAEARVGNPYQDLVRSCVRVLLPVALVVALLFVGGGVPMTLAGAAHHTTLEGAASTVARGPVASFLAIKELGSNGGGFFGPNDAHPFENPTFFTFALHHVAVLLLPMAFIVMLGAYLRRPALARMVFGVMAAGLLLLAAPAVWLEQRGNPALATLGVAAAPGGNQLEGKEVRFGVAPTAAYAAINMAVPAGTIAGAQDSYLPAVEVPFMLLMQIDAFFGGLGTGFLNMLIYVVIAAFVASLMVGRTPELLGKKVEAPQMQAAILVAVAGPVVVLASAALAAWWWATTPDPGTTLGWLGNHGAHGFSAMLYELISATAGNGSGFGSLSGNNPFWNLLPCLAMLVGRFVPMVGTLLIVSGLLPKPALPHSLGAIRLESVTFAALLLVVIAILGALLFFPALTLGPLAELLGGR